MPMLKYWRTQQIEFSITECVLDKKFMVCVIIIIICESVHPCKYTCVYVAVAIVNMYSYIYKTVCMCILDNCYERISFEGIINF